MVYYHSNIRGYLRGLLYKILLDKLSEKDIVVILGDSGFRYFGKIRDEYALKMLASVKPSILVVCGMHQVKRLTNNGYKSKEWNGGTVWYEDEYPNLLFAQDGEIYTLGRWQHAVLHGVYDSVEFSSDHNKTWHWWDSDKLENEINKNIEARLQGKHADVILSCTNPFDRRPIQFFIEFTKADMKHISSEKRNNLLNRKKHTYWYRFHWHIKDKIDVYYFLFSDLVKQTRIIAMTRNKPDSEYRFYA